MHSTLVEFIVLTCFQEQRVSSIRCLICSVVFDRSRYLMTHKMTVLSAIFYVLFLKGPDLSRVAAAAAAPLEW